MKVSDILKVKGNALYTVQADEMLSAAVATMSERDIGSVVVVERGEVTGMLTFREIIKGLADHPSSPLDQIAVRERMSDTLISCTPETSLDEVSRLMLEHHTRYLPVIDNRVLMGVISFYDVAKAILHSRNLENQLLKAYIRDWPEEQENQAGL
ncbi:MAG: CBS domain-containing protein [Comamonadaceae bacterium]|nr:CBS domain-containing protein [Comamonadaceae bacterium]